MICPRCSTANVATAQFCSKCGASLTGPVLDAGVAARLAPETVNVDPGGRVELTLSVRNDTRIVEHVGLTVEDPSHGWAQVAPESLRMMPGATSTAVVRLMPPRSGAVPAGAHPLRVNVARSGSGVLLAHADARVELGAFFEVSAQVIPREARAWFRSRRRVWLDNTANAEVAVQLVGSDPDDALRFTGTGGSVILPPGAKISRPITVNARRPNLSVHRRPRDFAVTASWEETQKVVVSGVLAQRGLILVLALLIAVLLVLIIVVSL
jgi:zinc-ribbon domain